MNRVGGETGTNRVRGEAGMNRVSGGASVARRRAATAPVRIAVIGAECTGKSSLCEALAVRLPALWVPEALREFCDRQGRTPRADEQAGLIVKQLARETAALRLARERACDWLVIDSSPLATALYSIELFDDPSLLEAAIAHQRGYDLTLLAGIDLPWAADGIQRDGPDARDAFHARLVAVLAEARIAHTLLHGAMPDRLREALLAAGRRPTTL